MSSKFSKSKKKAFNALLKRIKYGNLLFEVESMARRGLLGLFFLPFCSEELSKMNKK